MLMFSRDSRPNLIGDSGGEETLCMQTKQLRVKKQKQKQKNCTFNMDALNVMFEDQEWISQK